MQFLPGTTDGRTGSSCIAGRMCLQMQQHSGFIQCELWLTRNITTRRKILLGSQILTPCWASSWRSESGIVVQKLRLAYDILRSYIQTLTWRLSWSVREIYRRITTSKSFEKYWMCRRTGNFIAGYVCLCTHPSSPTKSSCAILLPEQCGQRSREGAPPFRRGSNGTQGFWLRDIDIAEEPRMTQSDYIESSEDECGFCAKNLQDIPCHIFKLHH